jgi:hypothetical protein
VSADRDRLLEARDHLSAAFEIVDEVGPSLPEPERGALIGVLGSRHDLARIIRQLGNVVTMLGTRGRTT